MCQLASLTVFCVMSTVSHCSFQQLLTTAPDSVEAWIESVRLHLDVLPDDPTGADSPCAGGSGRPGAVGGGSGGTGEDTAEADGAGAEPSPQLETKSSALVRINALLLDGEEIPVEMDEEVLLRNEAVPRNWAARARRLMASKPKLESLEVRVSGGGAPRPETPPSFVCVTAAVSRVLMFML
jgi:hypothetical protein